jgi:hypothetical protein
VNGRKKEIVFLQGLVQNGNAWARYERYVPVVAVVDAEEELVQELYTQADKEQEVKGYVYTVCVYTYRYPFVVQPGG